MKRIKLIEEGPEFSRFALGFWRLAQWKMSTAELESYVSSSLEFGITTMDHADIYGGYTCESIFGNLLKEVQSLRDKIEIVTKCGIKLVSENRPENKFHCYDTSSRHIIQSAERSLVNLQTDYIDLLLIHRPDPFMHPAEVASAFYELNKSGKVKHFGVSNFSPSQFLMLDSHLDFPLVTNQIEFSVMNLNPLEDGTIDLLIELGISPMAWSPLAGGRIFNEDSPQAQRLRKTLEEIKNETEASSIDQVALAFIANHPAEFNIVLGSGNIDRIKLAAASESIKLTREQWFKIWTASKGYEVP